MNAIGLMADAIPSTMSMLKMHEPTAFPSAISTSFFLAATIDVTSSGSDVPIDTMVSPTSVWLIPRSIAMRLALSPTTSPPTAMPTAPIRMKITAFGIEMRGISSTSSSDDCLFCFNVCLIR